MIGYITVPKSVAKEMIDNYPGDRVPVLSYNIETHIHKPTERKSKRRTKEIIDIAKEVGFQKNDIFDVLGCMTWENEIRSILLPKLLE
ncbi:hypothetical protein [Blautia obeum]|jgi:hypothetical protein|uniref:Uncharacterized protein n=1 Tax=Blautia obeum TaxID=40520 RepID=A0A415HVH9_9FIRM|nr:hypothetical protein [Blautia obeum]RHK98244.1 hypothetical protein DW040_02760 [Blautia obeum]